MSLFKRVDLKLDVTDNSERGITLAKEFTDQLNSISSVDFFDDKKVETLLLKQRQLEVESIGTYPSRPPTSYIFSPSSASKCERELQYKIQKKAKVETRYPYHRRWTRNSTAVHGAIQRDLLYSEVLLTNPNFIMDKLENGLPRWESNIKTHKMFNHNGVSFAILGMMDGILEYKDGTKIGFEFKTKSNSVAQVGDYLLKAPTESHREQCIAYSLLFGLDEFLITYESVAKDGWTKNAEAKADIKVFYTKVTEEDRQLLLDKFARVVQAIENDEDTLTDDNKCVFCPYQYSCQDYKVPVPKGTKKKATTKGDK